MKPLDEIDWLRIRGSGPEVDELKKALLILNKISTPNFDKLSKEFLALNYDAYEGLLEKVVNMLVVKAQEEKLYTRNYAHLCQTVHQELGNTSFLSLLLKKCQDEFNNNIECRFQAIDENTELSEAIKKERKTVERARYFGHMQFIGELFLKDLFPMKAAFTLVNFLLREGDKLAVNADNCLESYCVLMNIMGSKLDLNLKAQLVSDPKKTKQLIDCFEADVLTCAKLQKSNKVSMRVRFLLQDILEARARGWTPRQNEKTDIVASTKKMEKSERIQKRSERIQKKELNQLLQEYEDQDLSITVITDETEESEDESDGPEFNSKLKVTNKRRQRGKRGGKKHFTVTSTEVQDSSESEVSESDTSNSDSSKEDTDSSESSASESDSSDNEVYDTQFHLNKLSQEIKDLELQLVEKRQRFNELRDQLRQEQLINHEQQHQERRLQYPSLLLKRHQHSEQSQQEQQERYSSILFKGIQM